MNTFTCSPQFDNGHYRMIRCVVISSSDTLSEATFFNFGCGCQPYAQSCAPASCPVAYGPCGPQTIYEPRIVARPVVVQRPIAVEQTSSYVSSAQLPAIVKPLCGERRRKDKPKKRPKRRIETHAKDPKCNSERLKNLMHEHHSKQRDLTKVKRELHKYVEDELSGRYNVVCAEGDFSYITNTVEYCQQETFHTFQINL
ncbi:GRL-4 protein [Aphelenchoides avenae]|nr:GRL-4 protein [Aphelenchus avenae]